MSKIGAVLSGRIRDELLELAKVVDRAEQGWKKAKTKHDDYYLDGSETMKVKAERYEFMRFALRLNLIMRVFPGKV